MRPLGRTKRKLKIKEKVSTTGPIQRCYSLCLFLLVLVLVPTYGWIYKPKTEPITTWSAKPLVWRRYACEIKQNTQTIVQHSLTTRLASRMKTLYNKNEQLNQALLGPLFGIHYLCLACFWSDLWSALACLVSKLLVFTCEKYWPLDQLLVWNYYNQRLFHLTGTHHTLALGVRQLPGL